MLEVTNMLKHKADKSSLSVIKESYRKRPLVASTQMDSCTFYPCLPPDSMYLDKSSEDM